MKTYWSLIDRLSSDGNLSASDKQQAIGFLENAPVRENMNDNDAFRKKFEYQSTEYAKIRNDAYEQAKLEHGIHAREGYVEKVLNAPGDNVALRNNVIAKLLDDPRAIKLMDFSVLNGLLLNKHSEYNAI